MVNVFTSSGLTETLCHNFCEATGIGSVMDKSIDTSGYFTLFVLLAFQIIHFFLLSFFVVAARNDLSFTYLLDVVSHLLCNRSVNYI